QFFDGAAQCIDGLQIELGRERELMGELKCPHGVCGRFVPLAGRLLVVVSQHRHKLLQRADAACYVVERGVVLCKGSRLLPCRYEAFADRQRQEQREGLETGRQDCWKCWGHVPTSPLSRPTAFITLIISPWRFLLSEWL